jgi:hypothetical protein
MWLVIDTNSDWTDRLAAGSVGATGTYGRL